MRSRKGIRSTATPPTFLLILSTPSAALGIITTSTNTENVKVYLAITVFIHVNIVYK